MSYELDFWKYKSGVTLDHQQVYERLCEGQALEGLEQLPIAQMTARLNEVFRGWAKIDDRTFESPKGGVFQLYSTPQFLRIDCYGIDADDMNRMIEVAHEFGCPLYDPQVGIRYDRS
jgi:hypothetical protein